MLLVNGRIAQMLKKLLLNRWVITGLLISGAYGLGYYFAPDKIVIKEEEKIVYKTETEVQEDRKVREVFDPETGKVVERVEETSRREKTKDELESEEKKETTREKTQKNFAVKVGHSFTLDTSEKNIKTGRPVVGVETRIPSLPFTPNWVGLDVDTSGEFTAYFRFEF
jgi:hypothetical protein